MHAYLVAGMHEYLVRLEVFIFVWVSVYRISTYALAANFLVFIDV